MTPVHRGSVQAGRGRQAYDLYFTLGLSVPLGARKLEVMENASMAVSGLRFVLSR